MSPELTTEITDRSAVLHEGELGEWETVVGLEVHAELKTKTKLFCGCPNLFGGAPNTHVCPVCAGLPGSLPVLNEQAIELAIRIGLALNATVSPSVFSRKNYFYPDMPKDYQISQYDLPINVEGLLTLPDGKVIGIERAHLEEDTGKNSHVGTTGRINGADYSLVDYNRSGVPLIEIVSKPDMRNADEARAYVQELRGILVAIGASDGKMEEGSLRVDANISVHRTGEPFGTRCEIKNVNSLRSLGRAIDYEAQRQRELIERGESVAQQTRHWNEDEGRTHFARSKEEAYDYRYFPEPDLAPVEPDDAWVTRVRANMPTLPREQRERLHAASPDAAPEAIATVVDLGLFELVQSAINAGADARIAMNRASNELASRTERARELSPEHFAALIKMESGGKLTPTQAKQVLADMLDSGGDPDAIAKAKGFEAMSDDALEATVGSIVEAHPDEFARFADGDQKLMGFFTGQVMKATQGKANGKAVAALLMKLAKKK